MIIGIFGESCTGKSKIAECIAQKTGAKIFTGKDYIRLAKNEQEAQRQFIELLKSNESTDKIYIYVISEKEHLLLLPQTSVRVLVTAEPEIIKERFAKRMNGKLPSPVSLMLGKRHGLFDNEKYDLKIDNTAGDLSCICEKIINLLK